MKNKTKKGKKDELIRYGSVVGFDRFKGKKSIFGNVSYILSDAIPLAGIKVH